MKLEHDKTKSQEARMIWIDKIPYLKFPPTWAIQIIPPFADATVRFRVRTDELPKNSCVSVYLDVNNSLGYQEQPYWEVYPYTIRNSTFRCFLEDTDELIQAISEALKDLTPKKPPRFEGYPNGPEL